ncbi:hypothetical protein NMY22_g12271 [Coprinellus aureogranulatus]|nr:hypothetical protein NMY22_g12271 [Coprinellus aureogranulatus]
MHDKGWGIEQLSVLFEFLRRDDLFTNSWAGAKLECGIVKDIKKSHALQRTASLDVGSGSLVVLGHYTCMGKDLALEPERLARHASRKCLGGADHLSGGPKMSRERAPFSTIATLAAAVAFSAAPVSAIPAGTVALEEWFISVIPRIFPNATDNWQKTFEDGTLDPNIVFKMNAAEATTGLASMRAYWNATNSLIVSRNNAYVIDVTGIAAFSSDAEGKNGLVVSTGRSWIHTKEGKRYNDGVASTYSVVKWNDAKQIRSIVEWREVNTPPNYPYYPWSDTRNPSNRHSYDSPVNSRHIGRPFHKKPAYEERRVSPYVGRAHGHSPQLRNAVIEIVTWKLQLAWLAGHRPEFFENLNESRLSEYELSFMLHFEECVHRKWVKFRGTFGKAKEDDRSTMLIAPSGGMHAQTLKFRCGRNGQGSAPRVWQGGMHTVFQWEANLEVEQKVLRQEKEERP